MIDKQTPDANPQDMAKVAAAIYDVMSVSDGVEMSVAERYAAAALAALPSAKVQKPGLPDDIVKSLLSIGLVDWGQTFCQSDEKHIEDYRDTLKITREHFHIEADETTISYVALADTGTVLANTGNSPNSAQHARILVGAWNQLVEMARAETILRRIRYPQQTFDEIVENSLRIWFGNFDAMPEDGKNTYRVPMREIVKFVMSQNPAAEAAGYKLVPIDPTAKMLEQINLVDGFSEKALRARYAALLSAAPYPQPSMKVPIWHQIDPRGWEWDVWNGDHLFAMIRYVGNSFKVIRPDRLDKEFSDLGDCVAWVALQINDLEDDRNHLNGSKA